MQHTMTDHMTLIEHPLLPLRAGIICSTYDHEGYKIVFYDTDTKEAPEIVIRFFTVLAIQDIDEIVRTKIDYRRNKHGVFFELKDSNYLKYFYSIANSIYEEVETVKHYLFMSSTSAIDILTLCDPEIYVLEK